MKISGGFLGRRCERLQIQRCLRRDITFHLKSSWTDFLTLRVLPVFTKQTHTQTSSRQKSQTLVYFTLYTPLSNFRRLLNTTWLLWTYGSMAFWPDISQLKIKVTIILSCRVKRACLDDARAGQSEGKLQVFLIKVWHSDRTLIIQSSH